MRVGRILIENFRNFKNLELDSFPSSAVVVGENGIGKSNLLHALRLVLDPDLPDSARRLRAEDISEFADGTLASGVAVRVQIDLIEIDGDMDSEALCDGCYISLDPLIARLTYSFRPRAALSGDGTLARSDYEWSIGGGQDQDKDARRFRRDLSLTVLPALRDAVSELSRRGSPLQELLEARPPAAKALKTAATSVNDAMNELAKDKQIQSVAKDLSTRIADMSGPRLDIEPTLGFASSVPDRLLRSIRLFVDTERSRSVGDTSTGNANVIYLGMLLERLQSRRETDVVVDAILAVEEPEAHIHPVLQRQLFRYLISSETALVVTTHSPHIAAVSGLDSLVLLRIENSGATTAATASRLAISDREKKDLERYLDVTRAELLFCSAAILVEGPSELYILPELARALDFDLDSHGVVVANVSGTDFRPYRTLLGANGLRIPNVVITDGDPFNRKGEYKLYGLKRAAGLLPDEADRQDFLKAHGRLLEDGRGGSTKALRETSADADIFVGTGTLETDISPLLAGQMIAAMNELEDSENLKEKFAETVHGSEIGELSRDQSQELLRRISSVSKGRYAQRVASHVSTDAEDIYHLLADKIIDHSDVEQTPPESTAFDWLSIDRYGYVLAALDRISQIVRGHGLLDESSASVPAEEPSLGASS